MAIRYAKTKAPKPTAVEPKACDFWYTLGWDYEVTIFRTLKEAQAHAKKDGLHIFGGSFGVEFSGWVGRHE